jgi:hypothetical protein
MRFADYTNPIGIIGRSAGWLFRIPGLVQGVLRSVQ